MWKKYLLEKLHFYGLLQEALFPLGYEQVFWYNAFWTREDQKTSLSYPRMFSQAVNNSRLYVVGMQDKTSNLHSLPQIFNMNHGLVGVKSYATSMQSVISCPLIQCWANHTNPGVQINKLVCVTWIRIGTSALLFVFYYAILFWNLNSNELEETLKKLLSNYSNHLQLFFWKWTPIFFNLSRRQ